jgi:ankyrin repeat protein
MINLQDINGHSFLSLATNYGRTEIVELFLKNGANPNS